MLLKDIFTHTLVSGQVYWLKALLFESHVCGFAVSPNISLYIINSLELTGVMVKGSVSVKSRSLLRCDFKWMVNSLLPSDVMIITIPYYL